MGPTQTPTPNVPPSFGGFVPPKPHGDIILESEKPQKKSHSKVILVIILLVLVIAGAIVSALVINSSNSNNSSSNENSSQKDNDSASTTAASPFNTIAEARTAFTDFAKILIYEKPESTTIPNLKTDINDWYLVKVAHDSSNVDISTYGKKIEEEWSTFYNRINQTNLSGEDFQLAKDTINYPYKEAIVITLAYLQNEDFISQLIEAYSTSGEKGAATLVAEKFAEKQFYLTETSDAFKLFREYYAIIIAQIEVLGRSTCLKDQSVDKECINNLRKDNYALSPELREIDSAASEKVSALASVYQQVESHVYSYGNVVNIYLGGENE